MWAAYVGIVIVDAAGLPTETRLDEIKKLQQICAAGDLWRRCAIFRALDQLEPGATGRPAGAWLEPEPGEEWQFDAPTSTMSKLAREALIRIGGQDLAEALGSGVCEQNLLNKMDPSLAAAFNDSTHFSRKYSIIPDKTAVSKGSGAHMLKVGSKRRRTKQ